MPQIHVEGFPPGLEPDVPEPRGIGVDAEIPPGVGRQDLIGGPVPARRQPGEDGLVEILENAFRVGDDPGDPLGFEVGHGLLQPLGGDDRPEVPIHVARAGLLGVADVHERRPLATLGQAHVGDFRGAVRQMQVHPLDPPRRVLIDPLGQQPVFFGRPPPADHIHLDLGVVLAGDRVDLVRELGERQDPGIALLAAASTGRSPGRRRGRP